MRAGGLAETKTQAPTSNEKPPQRPFSGEVEGLRTPQCVCLEGNSVALLEAGNIDCA